MSFHVHLPLMRNGVLLTLLLISASLAGCTGTSGDEAAADGVDLKVYYDETVGVVEQTWRNGQQTGSQSVTLTFDFARVTSTDDPLVAFFVAPGDGRDEIVTDANQTASIDVEYATHGLYALTYGARTEGGAEASEEITVRIDLRIDWQDTGTTNPDDATIRVMTDGTQGVDRVAVSSTVANIGNVGGVFGRAVSATWELVDGSDGLRATGSAQIADGQEETWEGSSGPAEAAEGDWVLRITLDTDDEQVTVTSVIDVLHEESESSAQPFTSDQSEVDKI